VVLAAVNFWLRLLGFGCSQAKTRKNALNQRRQYQQDRRLKARQKSKIGERDDDKLPCRNRIRRCIIV